METIPFTVLGGGAEIGANSFLVGPEDEQVVLDCGVHPKKEGLACLPCLDRIEHPPQAVLISHGHVDHCGAVPLLLREFPSTECYATQPTVSIMDRMLHNSVSVMGTLALERGIVDYPLYTHQDVDRVIRRAYGLEYKHEFALTSGSRIRASFYRSGHVLGSAGILVKWPHHTLYYTGDLCTNPQELIPGISHLDKSERVDSLVIESTRGMHQNGSVTREGEVKRFGVEVTRVLDRGGMVLVPSFALGRTQELLNIISRLMRSGRIPDVPILASGLGRAIYEIYSKYEDYLRRGAELRPLYEFKRIGDVWERTVRRDLLKKSCIIVATSGMMIENTPSAMLAQDVVREERNGIFFVGYLDPDTLGYRLLHASPGDEFVFELSGRPVTVRNDHRLAFDFSAHANREDLLALIRRTRPKNVVFVHGDPEAIDWMMAHCDVDCRKHRARIGDTLHLDA